MCGAVRMIISGIIKKKKRKINKMIQQQQQQKKKHFSPWRNGLNLDVDSWLFDSLLCTMEI